MPTRNKIIRWKCKICKEIYTTKKEAESCENKKITQDKGVKKGDVVLITRGDGEKQKAKVTTTFVFDKYWGHYAWKRYWHTIGLTADIIDGWGSRQLTFDDYETL